MKKFLLIFHTLIHLRPIQIRYQVWYRFRKIWRKLKGFSYPLSTPKNGTALQFTAWIDKPVSYTNGTFTFLNQQELNPIPTDTTKDALWNYNLNYMDYLLQPGMEKVTGLKLIENFIQNLPNNPIAIEPYPIALRGINWVKFLSQHAILNPQCSNSLYAQYQILFDNIEYHLLGNHLLEDAFSLLFGAFYFMDPKLYNKAYEILSKELDEQILEDGAHFELSPMYHQIMLDRVLDCINLLQNNQLFENQKQLLKILEKKAGKMLMWLNNITLSNGEIPLLNDSAPNIAPNTTQLNSYATSLNIALSTLNTKLSSSGYRRFNGKNYECIIDIGHVGPSYQPGHAHADTFNFVLNVANHAVIVDNGISTYNNNATRLKERGTAAHNTVTVNHDNSSEVWSSFRMAKRAEVTILQDELNRVIAHHNGYRSHGITHQREWHFSEDAIKITDRLSDADTVGIAHFWFAPGTNPKQNGQSVVTALTILTFDNAEILQLLPVKIPQGYNRFANGFKLEVTFKHQLNSLISIR